MKVQLLHPLPHTPLRDVLAPLFLNASRVEAAVAFVTKPGVRTFLELVASDSLRKNTRFVASIRWPTDLNALAELAAKMPGRIFIHRGYFLPEEINHDRTLMHSKTVYVESSTGDVHVLVGSHNWTGQALDGNNLEASVQIECSKDDAIASQLRTHIDRCIAESEVFDPSRLEDYKAIQVALHGSPDGPDEPLVGFAWQPVVVIHAEEGQPGLAARLDKLRLYTPVWEDKDDKLFAKDQAVHLYLYPVGALFTGAMPAQDPVLDTGLVEIMNLPNARVRRRANCVIHGFDLPVLTELTGPIPKEKRRPVRQLVMGLTRRGSVRPMYYHRGREAPRFTREVNPRPLNESEQDCLAPGDSAAKVNRPAYPGAYTPESVDRNGRFIYTVPDDPVLCCVVSLPARELYPSHVEEEMQARVQHRTLFDESRVQVRVEPSETFRTYVYKVTFHLER